MGKLILFTSKQLSNGEYLICYRERINGKYSFKSTSISCSKSNWNNNLNRVSSKDRNYKEKNAKLDDFLNNMVNHTNVVKERQEEPNPEQIKVFSSIVGEFIALKPTYARDMRYSNVMKKVINAVGDFNINDDWQERFDEVLGTLNKEKFGGAYNEFCMRFRTIYDYARKNGYIKGKELKYDMALYFPEEKFLNEYEISVLINLYKKRLDIGKLHWKGWEKGLYTWILSLAFQGIEPADLLRLKKEDITIKEIHSLEFNAERALNEDGYIQWFKEHDVPEKYVSINLFRNKSKQPVKIVTPLEPIEPILNMLYEFKYSEYLIPALTDKQDDEKKKHFKICQWIDSRMDRLNGYLPKHCQTFELTPISIKVTMLTARKAFVLKAEKFGLSDIELKKLLGHNSMILIKNYTKPVEIQKQLELMKYIFN